jgi:aminopeptidase N
MPVAMKTVGGSMKTVQFEESPLMSTYLVAIVVGMFDYIESVTTEGISTTHHYFVSFNSLVLVSFSF